MKLMTLKPLNEQVFFITEATSGIGLATVHLAVEQGVKVFMTARNENELLKLHRELTLKGYDCGYSVLDVANVDEFQLAVERCLNRFGRIDTFVNNAGVSIYARLLDTSIAEARKLFETNFWGVVNGCKVAVPIMSEEGGVILNVGSVLSKVALPIQGFYSASKQAVKGFTDALRREVMAEKLPLQITLILPSSIDTPYTEHARTRIGHPTLTGPVYSPNVVAKAILKCATTPVREIGVGFPAYLFSKTERLFPHLQDRVLSRFFMEVGQREKKESEPERQREGSLFNAPQEEGEASGDYKGHVRESSLVTELALKKGMAKGAALVAGFFYLTSTRVLPWVINLRKFARP